MINEIDSKSVKDMLTEDDIIEVMMELGSAYPRTSSSSNALLFQTVCHGGDSFKLYYYIETKTFRCYTHCSCNYDIFSILEKIKEWDFSTAFKFICNKFGINGKYKKRNEGFLSDEKAHKEMLKMSERLNRKIELEELEEYDSSILTIFSNQYPIQWINDGISPSVMKEYGIKFQIAHNRAIIPVYDIKDRLIGIRCRNFDEKSVEDGFKYMPLKHFDSLYNFPTGKNLYGINIAIKKIKKLRELNRRIVLYVFEGEKSCMQLDTMKEEQVSVALLGSSFSEEQMMMIIKLLRPDEVVLCFDKEYHRFGDELFFKQKTKIEVMANKLKQNLVVRVIWDKFNLLDYKDSPTDKGLEVFERLDKNSVVVK